MTNWTPTPGNCYEDCYTLITQHPDFADAVLCHGWPSLTRADGDRPVGTVYGHAWLERVVTVGMVAGQPVRVTVAHDHCHLDNPVPVDLFYRVGNIENKYVARYVVMSAMLKALKAEHYGPWHRGPENKKKIN